MNNSYDWSDSGLLGLSRSLEDVQDKLQVGICSVLSTKKRFTFRDARLQPMAFLVGRLCMTICSVKEFGSIDV